MIYFIVNTTAKSGKSRETWKLLHNILKDEKIEYKAFETKYEGHARVLAGQISGLPDEKITLIVLGGDGTINEVINGITNFEKVKFGVIPAGSGNDFVAGIGMCKRSYIPDRDFLVRYLKAAINEKACENIDLGMVTYQDDEQIQKERKFAISCGIGLDAIVCKKALTSNIKKVLNKIHLGKLTYLILTVISLFTMDTAKCSLEADGETLSFGNMIFLAGMNVKAEGGGVPMTPHANFNDGKLSVCCAHDIAQHRIFFLLPMLVMAKHENFKCFTIRNYDTFSIHLDKPFVLHADGEYCGDVKDISMTCQKGILRIIKMS